MLGEPPIKMLRHLQQLSFFDAEKFNKAVRFVNLSAEALAHDLDALLRRIISEVESVQPGVVIVDSFRTVAHASISEDELQAFVQRLALHLTGWQATTFLIGEYEPAESQNNSIFTIADGIFWLTQTIERNACVRRLQVAKRLGKSSPAISAGWSGFDCLVVPLRDAPICHMEGPPHE